MKNNSVKINIVNITCHHLIKAIFACFLSALLATGCAMVPTPTMSVHTGQKGAAGNCADFFALLDKRIQEAGVVDPGYFRVKGYPYLRVNRFLASFRSEVGDKAAFAAWVDRLQALDQDAREYEIANLPDAIVAELEAMNGADLNSRIAACGDLMKIADLQDAGDRQRLRKSVSAPDDYIDLRRLLGIYPLTRLPVSYGISDWHAEVRKNFSLEPPVHWNTIRYIPSRKINMSSVSRTPAAIRHSPR